MSMIHKIYQNGYKKGSFLFIGMSTDHRYRWDVYADSFASIYETLIDKGVMHSEEAETMGFDFETKYPETEDDYLSLIKNDIGNAYYQSIYKDGTLIYSNWETETDDGEE